MAQTVRRAQAARVRAAEASLQGTLGAEWAPSAGGAIEERQMLGVWKVLGRVAVRAQWYEQAGVVGWLKPGSRCTVAEVREFGPGVRVMLVQSKDRGPRPTCGWVTLDETERPTLLKKVKYKKKQPRRTKSGRALDTDEFDGDDALSEAASLSTTQGSPLGSDASGSAYRGSPSPSSPTSSPRTHRGKTRRKSKGRRAPVGDRLYKQAAAISEHRRILAEEQALMTAEVEDSLMRSTSEILEEVRGNGKAARRAAKMAESAAGESRAHDRLHAAAR